MLAIAAGMKPRTTSRGALEAIILAGGKAERLGAARAAEGLVEIGGRPLASYQVALLARAGSTACS